MTLILDTQLKSALMYACQNGKNQCEEQTSIIVNGLESVEFDCPLLCSSETIRLPSFISDVRFIAK